MWPFRKKTIEDKIQKTKEQIAYLESKIENTRRVCVASGSIFGGERDTLIHGSAKVAELKCRLAHLESQKAS